MDDVNVRVFVDPQRGAAIPPDLDQQPKAQQATWVDQNSDYLYFGRGKKNTMGPDQPLAAQKPEGHPDGINIVFGDGHVEFVPMARAMELIGDKQRQRS